MFTVTRRNLLRSGLVLSAASPLLASPAWAHAAALAEASAAPLPPREKLLLDFGWRFQFGNSADPGKDLGFGWGQGDFAKTGDFGFAKTTFDDSKWGQLNLPHDWAVELPFVRDESQGSHGYKPIGRRYPETSVGWYRRTFDIPASDLGRRIAIDFDGAFRDVLIWVNGCFIGRNDNGYAPFSFDLTDFLAYGQKNVVVARVDASFGDGWFYEGAGIYRHVWLTKTSALHLGQYETYARASVKASVSVIELGTVALNQSPQASSAKVSWKIIDPAGKQIASAESPSQTIAASGSALFTASVKLANSALWSIETPNLYSAIATVESEGKVADAERIVFGIRTVVFDADKGFFLNGKSLKIQGTCNHQDHAGVGAAVPDRLQYFRLGVLKEMGGNAVRTSHNMPAPEWVQGCDRLGLMMMCETRQMSSNSEGLAQLEAMVKRYRNSPSIILWSIGNEEWVLQDVMPEVGAKIAATMVRRCHELDPTRPVSAAVNGSNEKGVSLAFDIIGFNYNLKYPDGYHKSHPKLAIYGSETASTVSTRGVYSTDPIRNTVSAYDLNVPPWANGTEEWWQFYATREWEAGGFAWTGFDYRGEPTPYGWPSINSQFGIVDMCGFPKDLFYYYQSVWKQEPILHLFPHWNWSGQEGLPIKVWVFSNCDEVELFVNGASAGSQKMPPLGHIEWTVKYAPGIIEARGSKAGQTISAKRETTGEPASIRLTPDRAEISADGEDLCILKVEVLDKEGRPVPTASNSIGFKVSGEGKLIGVGNGDPNCQESDKDPKRSLFNGLAQVILQSTQTPGEIHIEAVKEGWSGVELTPAKLSIPTRKIELRPQI